MRILLIFPFLVFVQLITPVFGQHTSSQIKYGTEGQKYILHKVEKGETIYSISKKYNIEQKELVSANSQLIFGLKEGDSLKILKHENEVSLTKNVRENEVDTIKFIFHSVGAGETVYGISKQYNIGVDAIYQYNPESRKELLENEILRIPDQEYDSKLDGLFREDNSYYYHSVQPGETIYALSRRYETTVNDILASNKNIDETIKTGSLVKIPKKQVAESVEEKNIGGVKYFSHTVESGDTYYSYKQRFGIEENELIEINPQLNDGLNVGLKIKIPAANISKVEVIPINVNDFYKYKVKRGDTFFGISQQYNISIIDLKELNPELKSRGLVADEELLIPKRLTSTIRDDKEDHDETITSINSQTESLKHLPEVLFESKNEQAGTEELNRKPFSTDTFNITMFLPLFFDLNEQYNLEKRSKNELLGLDSLKNIDKNVLEAYFEIISNENGIPIDTVLVDSMRVRKNRSLFPNSKYFVSFYQGFLLGLDSMQRAGAKVRLNLFDDQYNTQVADSLLMHANLLNTNLIIGPVDVRMQEKLSAFSSKNQIPFLSPLSSKSTILNKNPFYIQANPSKTYILKKTSDFIGDAFFDKNIVVMTLGTEEALNEIDMVKLLRDKLYNSGVYKNLGEVRFTQIDFTEGGHLGYWQLKRTLKHNIENIIYIPATENRSEREALLSRAINSLYVLSEEFDITLVGLNDYPMFKSINTEYFHQLNMHYLTSYNINYSASLTSRFVDIYRNEFKTEPDFYSFCAYDIALYFIGAYQKFGRHFLDNIKGYSPELTQSRFNFKRVDELSGFMNHALYIMNYSPTYTIDMISKVNEGSR